ncbi:MAG: OmpA family protein [Gemmatimonadales bacterium]|nr:OmpA family protein [Gemmatimonadales bacterium]
MPKIRIAVLALFIGGLVAAPTPAAAQLGGLKKKIKQKVDRAVDREVDQALDKTENEIRCTAGDSECIQKAKKDGKTVVVVNQDGDPVAVADTVPGRPGEGVWANYDFVPGNRILFAEDFSQDRVGDFPKRLEFVRGNMEIVEWQGGRYLRANASSAVRITLPETLPERFTIEFDMNTGAAHMRNVLLTSPLEGSLAKYPGSYFQMTSATGVAGNGPESTTQTFRLRDELTPVRIHVDGSYVKMYLNEQRVANLPNAEVPRSNTLQFRLIGNARLPTYLGNIRVAAGGRELYDVLEEEGRVTTQGILFDTGSDRIRPESTPTLEQMGDMMTDHPDLRIAIVGHTDAVGDDASNQSLSERRAASVRRYLIETYGIDQSRLEDQGKGETEAVADNDTPEGRQQNRRVELIKL